ncbi:MAG: 4Fe-4S binding protein, partial [Candidatus Bathyarchaeia archaeon]
MKVKIIAELCTGCMLCLKACPYNAIEVMEKKAQLLPNCIHCGLCIEACKFEAIVREEEEETRVEVLPEEYRGIWVFAEQREGKLMGVGIELLSVARQLSDKLSEPVGVLLLGNEVSGYVQELIAYGADCVYLVEDALLKDYQTELYTQAICELIWKY